MLDYGFQAIESRTLCSAGEFTYTLPVVGGCDDHVTVKNADTVRIILPRSDKKVECKIELPRFAFAPVREGAIVGRMVFYLDGEEIAETDLLVAFSVEKTPTKKSFFDIFKF